MRLVYTLLVLTALASPLLPLMAQQVLQYEIADITVSGCKQTAAATVQNLSGLQIGQKMNVPGTATAQAIRRLLQQQLFTQVDIVATKRTADLIWLDIQVVESPTISSWKIKGVNKKERRIWQEWLAANYAEGTGWQMVLANQIPLQVMKRLAQEERQSTNISVYIDYNSDSTQVAATLSLSPPVKAKIHTIELEGNEVYSSTKLRHLLGQTWLARRMPANEQWLEQARTQLVDHYHREGYADAHIITDKLTTEEDRSTWRIQLYEGPRYYFDTLQWEGAPQLNREQLQKALLIAPGDPFSETYLQERLYASPTADDISSYFLNQGYLFFRAEPVVNQVSDSSFAVTIRITEGPVSRIGEVNIEGNDRTNDHVLRRSLRTHPGQIFNRAAIVQSQRALANLGYFKPESMDVKTEVDPKTNEVDITYVVEEQRNDKFEIAASINPANVGSGGALIGTMGVTFNNFSLRNLLQGNWRHAYGDGQQLGMRFQSNGRPFQSLNLSFTEPWLKGQPQSIGFTAFYQRFADEVDDEWHTLGVTGGSVHTSQALDWGQGGWSWRNELGYQYIQLDRYFDIDLDDGNVLNQGDFHNLYLQSTLSYYSLDDPFFSRRGSRIELSGQWTPPFTTKVSGSDSGINNEWLAYHKYRLTAERFTPLSKKLILKTSAKMGWVFGYDNNAQTPPFERFELGGNGLGGSQQANFVGNDILALRGYDPTDISGTVNGGGTAFAKFSAELRYPLFNTSAARGFVLGFAEAGNAWKQTRQFSPWDMYRSVGLGIRLQLPMLGVIGLDYGVGLDQSAFDWQSDWKNGRFNLIFGFEPE